ncbi:LysR substrate-binding domain-containing protein [Aliamphritea hakodatensis]|uniref:LysR substrate-binding domain-containing protein n=1 Tax=Aliamphritea hakodatensis TaxID=2895352 RepID=UPI0022FD62F6|nr:LysR substrate-binding domain-containing protein [Aliamphritea hakodatensis]
MLLKDRLPSPQSLLVFEAAARHLSFTAAARELSSTQSAVSQLMRGLEAQLGLQLFRRIYRGVELTDAGEQLFEVCQKGFNSIAGRIEKLQSAERHPHINVATDFAFAAYWLLPRLPAFRELHPDTEVRIITSQGSHEVRSQDADVAIRFVSQPSADSIPLFAEEVFPVCSPGFLTKHGPVTSHKKLASLPLLKLGADAGEGWMDWPGFFSGRRSQVQPGEPVLTFNNYTLLIQAAIAGQGVGIGWGTLVDELIESGVLTGLKDFSLSSKGGYFISATPTPRQPDICQQFIEWLQQA